MPNHMHGIAIIAPPDTPRPITPDGYTVRVGTNRGENPVGTHGRASLQRRSEIGTSGAAGPVVGIVHRRVQIGGDGADQPASRDAGRPGVAGAVLRTHHPRRAGMAQRAPVHPPEPGAVGAGPASSMNGRLARKALVVDCRKMCPERILAALDDFLNVIYIRLPHQHNTLRKIDTLGKH